MIRLKKTATVMCGADGVWCAVCPEGLLGAFATTGSGRTIQFPKRERAFPAWLLTEAILEAVANQDDFTLTLFRSKMGMTLTDGDVGDLNDYVFDPKTKTPNGFLISTRPLARTHAEHR